MRHQIKIIVLCAVGAVQPALAQDEGPPVPLEKSGYHVPIFSNEYLNVLRVSVPSQRSSGYHTHSLDQFRILIEEADLTGQVLGETPTAPYRDPRGRGYQVIQSKIAVGDGGMWGRGVTQGTQTQLRFLPVPHTDFIFSAFAEEHGFVGVMLVLGLYFLLLMQIVQNAQTAPDRAGMYICMGVATLLLFHVLVNVGMVVGSMPVTGIPLPLMSSGGSNMFSVFMMLGLVNNVRLRRFAG